MPTLVTITGPMAAGENAAAEDLARRCIASGQTVILADVDAVAAMVVGSGAAAAGLWFAAHEAHGALVAQWMHSDADVIMAVGLSTRRPRRLPSSADSPTAPVWRVLIDVPLSVTRGRVRDDPQRSLSRQPEFHQKAHERFLSLKPGIPADAVFDSTDLDAATIGSAVFDMVKAR